MIRRFVLLLLLLSLHSNCFSQKTLNEYTHVVVPAQYEFMDQIDKYQLSSMSIFLFKKYGFNAYLEKEVPRYLEPCNGLRASLDRNSGMIYTTLTVILSDCNEKIVYQSESGRSKIKHFTKVHQDALRKAFASIQRLQVKQIQPSEKVTSIDSTDTKDIEQTKVSSKEEGSLPNVEYSTYRLDGTLCVLRKTDEGYMVYKEYENKDLVYRGKVVLGIDQHIFYDHNNVEYQASFDSSGNLLVKNDIGSGFFKAQN